MSRAVACVLKSGGVYTPEWVYRLKRQIEPFLSPGVDFICLTDIEVPGVKTEPLRHSFPGFWSKLELFHPENFKGYDKVLYLDLDVLVLDNLDQFFNHTQDFCIAHVKWYNEKNVKRCIGFQSSVMCFVPGKRNFYYLYFKDRHEKIMEQWYGDQDYLKNISPLSQTFPKEWVLKLEPPHLKETPPDAKIVLCIRPKNNELVKQYNWVKDLWGPPLDE